VSGGLEQMFDPPPGVCRGHPVAGVFALGRARAGVGGRVSAYLRRAGV